MSTVLEKIHDELGHLKLDDSLLALNHFLSVSRRFANDSQLEAQIGKREIGLPPYIVHFLAKQLLLHASNVGRQSLDWPTSNRLIELCTSLDDPIQHDPNWKHADPTGFFERALSQQLPAQAMRPIQSYGLALGLFRDLGVVSWPERYDLPSEIEQELGVPVEQFIALGQVCLSLRQASHNGKKCMGTFRQMLLAEAYSQGIHVCVPEVWRPFLARVACRPDVFRNIANSDGHKAKESHFVQFEFNPLRRFPIIEVSDDHFVAVDPLLIAERTTYGLFYDLFERHGPRFAERFGHSFDRFVGQLLGSVCPAPLLWSAAEWEESRVSRGAHGKIGDWAFRGNTHTILFECKSLRPSLELTTYGSDDSVQKVTDRIVSALGQLGGHAQEIGLGRWQSERLTKPAVGVVVTYGRIHTINGPFTRKRIRERLVGMGLGQFPFVVLSLQELDMLVRLVELGHPFDELVLSIASRDGAFKAYREALAERAVSSFAFDKGAALLESLVPSERK
jgi:hypothetical protein